MSPPVMLHWCDPCHKWTRCESEETLPADLKSGDPGYYDPDKCGLCGEFYQCQECGAPWDGVGNQCSEPERHETGGTTHWTAEQTRRTEN